MLTRYLKSDTAPLFALGLDDEQNPEPYKSNWMIWEGTPGQSTVEELKKSGLDSLTFEPCDNVPESGDYLSVTRQNVLNLNEAFSR